MQDYLISTLPITLRDKGRVLLEKLKTAGKVNSSGHLMFNGQIVQGSNIHDLLDDVLRRRRTAPPPKGWKEFAQVLDQLNISREFISNQRYKPPTTKKRKIVESDSEEDEFEDTFDERPPNLSKEWTKWDTYN